MIKEGIKETVALSELLTQQETSIFEKRGVVACSIEVSLVEAVILPERIATNKHYDECVNMSQEPVKGYYSKL